MDAVVSAVLQNPNRRIGRFFVTKKERKNSMNTRKEERQRFFEKQKHNRQIYDVNDAGEGIEAIYHPSDAEIQRRGKQYTRERYTFEQRHGVTSGRQLEEELREALVETVASAFGEAPSDTADHLRGDLLIIARDQEKRVAAFAAFDRIAPSALFPQTSDLQEKGGYFAAAAVHQEYQQEGIYHVLTEERVQAALDEKLPVVFTRTQNPAVEQGIRSELLLAQDERRILGYQLERRLVPGCYGQQLAKNQPRVTNPEVAGAYNQLDVQAGDAYILVFHLKYRKDSR